MTRLTHALAALYGVCAIALAWPAYASWQRGSVPYALFFAGVSVLLATAIAHHAYSRDEIAALRIRLQPLPAIPDPAPMPAPPAPPARDCCVTWWATAGADHDPEFCTRKDHLT